MTDAIRQKQQWTRWFCLWCGLVCCALSAGSARLAWGDSAPAKVEPLRPDAERAYNYLLQICRIGPRKSGSAGMAAQQHLLGERFSQMGAQVAYQPFDAVDPVSGAPVRMNNLIVSWHPDRNERILIACHYDTRPYPDRDIFHRRGTFIGANDGGSGVALLLELGHWLPKLNPRFGVDFIFFDGEELVYGDRGDYFLGSEYFSQQYRENPPRHRYHYGVLVDMVADRNLGIYIEKNSQKFAPQIVRSIWNAAGQVGVREFIPRTKHEVQDDHIPLNKTAGIPTCDLIDFDYPYWHTTKDIPANCSGESLAKVGQVLLHWLTQLPDPPAAVNR